MSKHTPGPWHIAYPYQTAGWGLCVRSSSRILVRVVGRDQSQKEADARLIAAAPELLEALKAMLDYYGSNTACVYCQDMARAAIAKAEAA